MALVSLFLLNKDFIGWSEKGSFKYVIFPAFQIIFKCYQRRLYAGQNQQLKYQSLTVVVSYKKRFTTNKRDNFII